VFAPVKASAQLLALVTATLLAAPAWSHAPAPPLAWALPDGATVIASELDGERLDLYLVFAGEAAVTEEGLEVLVRAALSDADEAGLEVRSVLPWVSQAGAWVPLAALLPPVSPVPRRPYEDPRAGPAVAPPRVGKAVIAAEPGRRRDGALRGKVVYLSAGHGFSWTPELGRWATQRGNTNGIVEDLVSAEVIDQLLVTYLENAGATVFTVRERDLQRAMVIVDADTAGATRGEGVGTYSELGTFRDLGSGYRGGLAPLVEGENPFALGASRVVDATLGEPTAKATFSFEVPRGSDYTVYAAWVADPSRATDAHYVVFHDGGASHVRVNQRRHGGTWFALGRFRFATGGRVELWNDAASAAATLSADAIRVGGGMGDAARGNGSGPASSPLSGRPRWEENARYHIQFTGAPQSVYRYTADERSDDVGSRSRYAAWQNEAGEDAVYLAWHTNAPSPGVGTSTYVYGPNPPDGTYDFTGVAGSDKLARFVHDEVVADLRAAVDPTWRDRGVYSAYFGELNKNHNPEMPSVLCEVAFHATASDAAQLKEPRMRQVAARAFYQGLVRYFADRDGQPVRLLPEPPRELAVVGTGPGEARLTWRAADTDREGGGDLASAFRVYRSQDGRAFDDGTETVDPVLALTDLAPDAPTFFRVTAVNAGGESLSTPVVAVLPACSTTRPRALLVHGFYRLDSGLAPQDDLSAYDLGTVLRMRLDAMNRFDALVPHAFALAAAGLAFDSAEATAVASRAVALDPYGLVDWALGEESTVDETLSDLEQGLLSAWLGPGRALLLSGAELAWDLDFKGSASDRAFLAGLGAAYGADSAGTYAITHDGAQLAIDDGTHAYDVAFPDVLTPVAGATPIASYAGGLGGTAGLRFARPDGATALVFGAPLEALYPDEARNALVTSLLADLPGRDTWADLACGDPDPDPGPEQVEPTPEPDVEVVDGTDIASNATPGRPTRTLSGRVRETDGCAASRFDGSCVSVSMLVSQLVVWLSLWHMVRRMRSGGAR
jgi:N-acetylmuramoyl-L-alanine amidase